MSNITAQNRYSKATKFLSLFLMVIIALVLLISIEFSLRLLNLGVNPSPFTVHSGNPELYADNPQEFINIYHARTEANSLSELPNLFHRSKPRGRIRGIVIGESTPQGIPYRPNQAFPKIAETAINTALGREAVEILNISGSALTSFYLSDVSRRLKSYDPDFVVMYAGHNEYYGTITVADGRAAWVQRLYTQLKQFRLVQLIMNLFVRGAESDATLMQQRFAEAEYFHDEDRDSVVAAAFIENIHRAVEHLTENGIAVFVFQPVSNIIGFPPFSSVNTTKPAELVQQWNDDLLQAATVQSYLDENPKSAIANYLYGRIANDVGRDGTVFMQNAVDYDTIPFRARSYLTDALSGYAESQKANSHFYYIPTQRLLERDNIPLDNRLFIDQLHFSFFGHTVMARYLASAVTGHFYPAGKQAVKSYFDSSELVREKVFLTPFDEFFSALRMNLMLAAPPYSEMELPFPYLVRNYTHNDNRYLDDQELFDAMQQADQRSGMVDQILRVYFERANFGSIERQLQSEVWNNPGHSRWYSRLGSFYMSFPDLRDDGLRYWAQAYQLAENKSNVLKNLEEQYDSLGTDIPWTQIKTSIIGN